MFKIVCRVQIKFVIAFPFFCRQGSHMYVFMVGQYTDNSGKNAFEQNTISPYISRPIQETSSCRPMQFMEGTASDSQLERYINRQIDAQLQINIQIGKSIDGQIAADRQIEIEKNGLSVSAERFDKFTFYISSIKNHSFIHSSFFPSFHLCFLESYLLFLPVHFSLSFFIVFACFFSQILFLKFYSVNLKSSFFSGSTFFLFFIHLFIIYPPLSTFNYPPLPCFTFLYSLLLYFTLLLLFYYFQCPPFLFPPPSSPLSDLKSWFLQLLQ